jgi:tetratricopeptide (TPR) repeat protein
MFQKLMQSVKEFFADEEEEKSSDEAAAGAQPATGNQMLRAATSKLMQGDYEGAIKINQEILQMYPDLAGGALQNIGACRSLQGRYQEAVTYYLKSREVAGESSSIEENILEAVAKAHKAGEREALGWYRSAYPKVPEAVLLKKVAKAG